VSTQRATASAPASVGNVAVGFDLLGHVIEGPADRVTAIRTPKTGVCIDAISGIVTELPHDPQANTAGQAVAALLEHRQAPFGVALEIDKGIPLSSGLGGSAASAVAAVVAANALFDQPLAREALYPFALAGERVASGAAHGDNVAPQLVGGLVLATAHRIVRIPVPAGLHAAVVHPDCRVETRAARAALERNYRIGQFVAQHSRLALLLSGCFTGNLELIADGLIDELIEPARAPLIPGFAEVKAAALASGALGGSISGAGPSVFAWCQDRAGAEAAGHGMAAAFTARGLRTTVHVSPVDSPGARLLQP